MGKEEDIFSDKFETKPQDNIEETPKDESKPTEEKDWKPNEEILEKTGVKTSKRKYSVIGAIVVGIIVVLGYFTFTMFINAEPFDASDCNFGVKKELFGDRCMTQDEFIKQEEATDITPKPTTTPPQEDKDPFRDISSTSDKVEVGKNKDPIGYYMITTDDDWYGDFVDIRKVPSKIEKSGSMKINFRCYTDDFQGTSTYFGTFRNVIKPDLTVEVYINGIEVETKTTNVNKALILEGSCYGHES